MCLADILKVHPVYVYAIKNLGFMTKIERWTKIWEENNKYHKANSVSCFVFQKYLHGCIDMPYSKADEVLEEAGTIKSKYYGSGMGGHNRETA